MRGAPEGDEGGSEFRGGRGAEERQQMTHLTHYTTFMISITNNVAIVASLLASPLIMIETLFSIILLSSSH